MIPSQFGSGGSENDNLSDPIIKAKELVGQLKTSLSVRKETFCLYLYLKFIINYDFSFFWDNFRLF